MVFDEIFGTNTGGPAEDNSWNSRLLPATYESPSKKVFSFNYEDVGKETDKKTVAFSKKYTLIF